MLDTCKRSASHSLTDATSGQRSHCYTFCRSRHIPWQLARHRSSSSQVQVIVILPFSSDRSAKLVISAQLCTAQQACTIMLSSTKILYLAGLSKGRSCRFTTRPRSVLACCGFPACSKHQNIWDHDHHTSAQHYSTAGISWTLCCFCCLQYLTGMYF